jgi:hypothetical protein
MSGAPWEDGTIDFELSLEGLTQLEMQLINDWISAGRTRIIKIQRTQIAFIVCRLSGRGAGLMLAVRVPIAI